MPQTIRQAYHSNSWYPSSSTRLDADLTRYLSSVPPSSSIPPAVLGSPAEHDFSPPIKGCRAIIGPHAGYSYSGPTAGWAYRSLDTEKVDRVFILGPSHKYYLDGCALSSCDVYKTPLGDLELDKETINKLKATSQFSTMSVGQDEDEHSIEMHLPFIFKLFIPSSPRIKIVPILIGSISKDKEEKFGSLLAPYFAEEGTRVIVSSDFCHWGKRFSYTRYTPTATSPSISLSSSSSIQQPIHESIRQLDLEALTLLTIPSSASPNPAEAHRNFDMYLKKTKNTICGRHPIGVLLGALAHIDKVKSGFIRYERSEEVDNVGGSSVSYVAGWVTF